ncbi:MAG: cytochrome c biogenesis protein ResB [Calditrichaeota bacterium]|nr:cytochrome c biogenesis protein ResB [Calditrichota bacterium]MCB9365596.1 cytochrome c biogenesis protein ResB [Calditrichota bacterium]
MSRKPKLWAMLSTMKFAIWILIVLGVLSLASLFSGELVDPLWMKQEPSGAGAAFGQLVYKTLEMDQPFSSWWYRGLLGVLSLSLFACVLERTPIVWRMWSRKPELDPRAVNERTAPIYITTSEPSKPLIDRLSKSLGTRADSDGVWVGESHRLALWGPLLTHIGLLLLAIGGLVGSFGGTHSRAGGYAGDIVAAEDMPFEVRIDSFRVEYYPFQPGQWVLVDGEWIGRLVERDSDNSWKIERRNQMGELELVSMEDEWISNDWDIRSTGGNIKQYISSVTVLEDGQEVLERQISVNTPLRYRGFRLYQSSYDPDNPRVITSYDQVTLVVSDTLGNVLNRLPLKQGGSVQVPDDSLTIFAGRFLPDFKLDSRRQAYSASGNMANPAVELLARGPNGYERLIWSFLQMQGHQITIGAHRFEATEIQNPNTTIGIATIFEIRRTIGTEFLWLGFVVSSLGLILCFYMTHRIVYVQSPSADIPLTRVYAFSKKMIRGFEHDLEAITKQNGATVEMTVQPEIVSY